MCIPNPNKNVIVYILQFVIRTVVQAAGYFSTHCPSHFFSGCSASLEYYVQISFDYDNCHGSSSLYNIRWSKMMMMLKQKEDLVGILYEFVYTTRSHSVETIEL